MFGHRVDNVQHPKLHESFFHFEYLHAKWHINSIINVGEASVATRPEHLTNQTLPQTHRRTLHHILYPGSRPSRNSVHVLHGDGNHVHDLHSDES